MSYNKALDYLAKRTRYEGSPRAVNTMSIPLAGATDDLNLDAITEIMSVLGDPHTAYKTIHVTGTNGKGSVCRFASSILSEAGLSVGTYTSPDLEGVRERISWDGTPISEDDFARIIGLVEAVEPMLSRQPGRFEILTAAAFAWFGELGVDVAVVEVGLLGRFDATNLVDADVAVITNIGKDHTSGDAGWETDIAREKAGIIKPASHLVLGSEFDEVRSVLLAEQPGIEVTERGIDFFIDADDIAVGGHVIDLRTELGRYEGLFVPFHGAHMAENAATAVVAVEALFGRFLEQDLVEPALANTEISGRFEIVGREPTVILEGAHNPHGAAAALETLTTEFARLGSWIMVIGFLEGRDVEEMFTALGADDFDAVIICQPTWSRARDAHEVAAIAAKMGIDSEVVVDPTEAYKRALSVAASDDLVFVVGSLYVVGEIRPTARSVGN